MIVLDFSELDTMSRNLLDEALVLGGPGDQGEDWDDNTDGFYDEDDWDEDDDGYWDDDHDPYEGG